MRPATFLLAALLIHGPEYAQFGHSHSSGRDGITRHYPETPTAVLQGDFRLMGVRPGFVARFAVRPEARDLSIELCLRGPMPGQPTRIGSERSGGDVTTDPGQGHRGAAEVPGRQAPQAPARACANSTS